MALKSGNLDWVDAIPDHLGAQERRDTFLRSVTADNAGLPQFLLFNVTKPCGCRKYRFEWPAIEDG